MVLVDSANNNKKEGGIFFFACRNSGLLDMKIWMQMARGGIAGE